jgi:N-ethylmaleimide reductase
VQPCHKKSVFENLTNTANQPLLQPIMLGSIPLRNRVVMTRSRARSAALGPTFLHREYYRQRAGAGLIVSEGGTCSAASPIFRWAICI